MGEFLGRDYPEPEIGFNVNGVDVECGPSNTTLFTYRKIGSAGLRLSVYDHLFYHDEEQDIAIYGFLTNMEEARKQLLMMSMLANGYSVVANQDQVAECDLRAYDRYVIQPQLGDIDHVPDEWDTK